MVCTALVCDIIHYGRQSCQFGYYFSPNVGVVVAGAVKRSVEVVLAVGEIKSTLKICTSKPRAREQQLCSSILRLVGTVGCEKQVLIALPWSDE